MRRIAAVILFVIASLLPCLAADTSTATAKLIVHWSPQSQFAGYYLAEDLGLYRKHGVDVGVLRGGPGRDSLSALVSGEATFATAFLSAALVRRDAGVPLVHLTQIVNQSNQMLVAWRGMGISDIRHLNKRRVSVWDGDLRAAFLGLFKTQAITPHVVSQYYSTNLFLLRGVAACAAMYYNEFDMLYQAGVDESELSLFFLRDYGLGAPEDGIYCLEETFRREPGLCRAVVDASLEGWGYAAQNRDKALAVVMGRVREAHVVTNYPHMAWMLDKILPTIVPPPGASWKLGELDPAAYDKTASLLKETGLISNAPAQSEFHREPSRP